MDTDRILAGVLGGLCVLLVLAVSVLALWGREPSTVLTASLSACLGALFAMLRPPDRRA